MPYEQYWTRYEHWQDRAPMRGAESTVPPTHAMLSITVDKISRALFVATQPPVLPVGASCTRRGGLPQLSHAMQPTQGHQYRADPSWWLAWLWRGIPSLSGTHMYPRCHSMRSTATAACNLRAGAPHASRGEPLHSAVPDAPARGRRDQTAQSPDSTTLPQQPLRSSLTHPSP